LNILELKEFNKEHVVYMYQPEGRGEYGEIVYNFENAEAVVVKKAEDESERYAHKAKKKVEECVKKNNLPIKVIQAWC